MPTKPPSPDEWMRRFGTLPLIHQPGERWMYNTGAQVLGVLVARASGKPFDLFMEERLFGPLGMRDTQFFVPTEKLDRFTTSYVVDPGTRVFSVYDPRVGSQWAAPPAFPDGAAGLVSTVDDCLAFQRLLLRRGLHDGRRLLAEASVTAMTTDQLTPEEKARSTDFTPGFFDDHGWGFGMAVITRGDAVTPVPGRFGWDGGLGTSAYADPRADFVGVLLTQRMWDSPAPPAVQQDFWKLAYASLGA
jgi:CubicO group peptidase (beta-lactamase class C family)